MPGNQRRFWPSNKKHSHIMGELRRVAHGNGTITALYLYENSVRREDVPVELPPARLGALVGACDGIVCTICKAQVDWIETPTESYLRLMEHYGKT